MSKALSKSMHSYDGQPDELKRLLEPVMTAAALSWQNVLLVGAPGYGKTEIPLAMMRQMFGEEHTMLFPCVPSSLPADIIGYANPIYAIDPEAEAKGIPYWIVKGTPVDESILGCLLDEVSRFGDLGADTMVHAMHPVSKFHRPIYFGTANWLTPTPRNEALRDRFSFTIFFSPTTPDVRALVRKPAIDTWQFDLPTWEQICEVNELTNAYVANPDGFKANEAIIQFLENLIRVCEGTDFSMNNRRIFQFRHALYAMGVYAHGAVDFSELPRGAFRAMEYAYPVIDPMQSLGWRKIVNSLVDRLETEIAEFQSNAYAAWSSIFSRYADRSGRIPPDKKDEMSRELGRAFQSNDKALQENFPSGGDRIQQARHEMFAIYKEMITGKNPLNAK